MRRTAVAVALAILPSAGCGWGDDPGDDDGTTLTVLAASSLTDVFEDLAEEFEADHDGVQVELAFGSSTDLAEQAVDGAPGDVLATADETAMTIAEDGSAATDAASFATNVLVIATPPDNPAGIETLDDLDDATWVRCADEAPCGKVAVAVLETQQVTAEPASLEEDARATLDKVVSGEADAALVYASDAASAGEAVATIEIPDAEDQLTTYFIAPLGQAADDELAQEWVDLVTGSRGRSLLRNAGFGLP